MKINSLIAKEKVLKIHAVIVIKIIKNTIIKVIQDARVYLEKEMSKYQFKPRHLF